MSSTTKTLKSSRKCKAPIDDNGEPVMVSKKKAPVLGPHPSKKPKPAPTKKVTPKAATTSKKKTLPVKKTNTNQQVPTRSASVEDMYNEEDHPHPNPPRNPQHILESVDSGGEDEVMDVDDDGEEMGDKQEEAEEDDDAELGWFTLLSYSVKIAKFYLVRLTKDWTSPVYIFFQNT
jgi:hypothetical protein